ncbi:hypothetical protein ACIBP6_09340 [Nonomuraea terrae]|uniref:hypothetical protein n=1 Tax=Nonomuraea terrae TaxID=2530383 RepID=UPI00379D63B2
MTGSDGGADSTDIDALVSSLRAVVEAFDHARTFGLPVAVPASLYQACLEVVTRHDPGPDPGQHDRPARTVNAASVSRADQPAASVPREAGKRGGPRGRRVPAEDVPLRRLVWQVIDPDQDFTVADVVQRLEALGASWPANRVSNALGYWVTRGRLHRERKGVYRCRSRRPIEDLEYEEAQAEDAAPDDNYAEQAWGREDDSDRVQTPQRKAM